MKKNQLLSLFCFIIILASCKKEEGCMDPTALNYNPDAQEDDGSCIAAVEGCLDPLAINYNIDANVSDDNCLYAFDIALGVWNIDPDCEDLTIPVIGTISLNDQLPDTIEIQASTDNSLFIDISGQQVSGSIDNLGVVTVPQQTVQFDPGLGFPLDVLVEGTGQVNADNTGSMDISYTFDIPLVGLQSISCSISLYK